MKNFFLRSTKSRKGQRGQGMTEYIIIVALIAVSAIGIYAAFGKTIRNQVAGLAGEVAGSPNSGQSNAAATANAAATSANSDKKMGSYGGN